MNFKNIALCALALACGMASPTMIKASETKGADREPRANGVASDIWTRMELGEPAAIPTVLAATFGTGSPTIAKAVETNIDRVPRTNGVAPDMWTQMELGLIVNRYAEAAGIPTALARAVVRVESDWDQTMTGLAGEIGLMQIMPQTAREMGFAAAQDELYDPETNIRWGVRYLAEAWRLAEGDVCQTVLKYNAGHQATKMTPAADEYCTRVRTLMTSMARI
jgi:Transglycosylase SLT domain